MGRPKKKLTDNSVKVRYKTLADGRKSVYLDCCDGGRRTYDFLKLYLLPETDREAVRRNKATMKKVEELQRERTLQLLGIGNGGTGDKPVFHTDMPLSEWMDAYIGEQKRYGVKNTAIITKVARILGTIAPDVRMSQVDKDFCLMFIDYLRNDLPCKVRPAYQPDNGMGIPVQTPCGPELRSPRRGAEKESHDTD